jgi:hypothetical protein
MLGRAQLCEEFSKFLVRKLWSIVRYDGLWNSESHEDVSFEETENVMRCYFGQWFCLYPFGKVVHSYY